MLKSWIEWLRGPGPDSPTFTVSRDLRRVSAEVRLKQLEALARAFPAEAVEINRCIERARAELANLRKSEKPTHA